ALGGEVVDLAVADDGAPDATPGVHGEPVGSAVVADGHEGAAVVQATVRIPVEDGDAAGPGVVVVGPRPVRRPLDAVGDRHVLELGGDTQVGGHTVEAGRADRLVVGHGAAVERPVRRAPALVHPYAGIGPDLDPPLLVPVGVEEGHTTLHADDGAAADPRADD